jgi:hypothetical protein
MYIRIYVLVLQFANETVKSRANRGRGAVGNRCSENKMMVLGVRDSMLIVKNVFQSITFIKKPTVCAYIRMSKPKSGGNRLHCKVPKNTRPTAVLAIRTHTGGFIHFFNDIDL